MAVGRTEFFSPSAAGFFYLHLSNKRPTFAYTINMKTLDTTYASNCGQDGCYFRMYKDRDDLICIIEVQYFDEYDYDETRFVRNKQGERYYWTTERAARKQMIEWFDKKQVAEEYHYLFHSDSDFDNVLIR